jgi:transposase
MRRGRPIPALKLTENERESLSQWMRRPKSAQALAQRARIILACAEGLRNTQVGDRLHLTVQTVGKWRSRFVQKRLDGLLDEVRPGTSQRLTDKEVEEVLAMTLESTPKDATHWSTRSMAQACGLSHMSVHRIWQAFALAPHRSESFKLSKDPLY